MLLFILNIDSSRANFPGQFAKPFDGFELTVGAFSSCAIARIEFLRLKRSVEEEIDKLPREVDIVNLDAAPDWFLDGIDYDPVFLAGNSNAWSYFKGVLDCTKRKSKA